jgi:hypothetical protein
VTPTFSIVKPFDANLHNSRTILIHRRRRSRTHILDRDLHRLRPRPQIPILLLNRGIERGRSLGTATRGDDLGQQGGIIPVGGAVDVFVAKRFEEDVQTGCHEGSRKGTNPYMSEGAS